MVAFSWFSLGVYSSFGTYYTFNKSTHLGEFQTIADIICYGKMVPFNVLVYFNNFESYFFSRLFVYHVGGVLVLAHILGPGEPSCGLAR